MNCRTLSALCGAVASMVTLAPPSSAQPAPLAAAPVGFDKPREGIARGTVETVEYDSRTVGAKRRAVVYLPPGYSTDQRYPVLYLMGGIGQTEVAWTREGSAHVILDNLLADRKAVPTVVVMPNGRASAEPAPNDAFDGDPLKTYGAFEADLLDDLIPFVEARYAVRGDREHRAMAGLSMGGGQTLNIALAHPEAFAWMAAFSSAPNSRPAGQMVRDPEALSRAMRLIWLSCGERDGLMFVSRAYHDYLAEKKVPHVWRVNAGHYHSWPSWQQDLWSVAQLLFREGAAPITASIAPPAAATPVDRATPKLHVAGRDLCDPTGRNVRLRGYMQPGASWFNGEGRNFAQPRDYTDPANVAPALTYYKTVADILTDPSPRFGRGHGWSCRFVRYIADGSAPHNFAPGWNAQGELAQPAQFDGWMRNVLAPYVDHCRARGLYVVLVGNPSVAFPTNAEGKEDPGRNMSAQYQRNLIRFWSAVAAHPSIKGADNVHFEICNEPISIETRFGAGDWGMGRDAYWKAITEFMQPVVDAIRAEGADNVIWVPGLGWQGEYAGFATYPVKGANIGYAAHWYPAYGGAHDDVAKIHRVWRSNYKPAADMAPMLITEMFWNPNSGRGYQGLWNGHTAGFGNVARGCIEDQGNVSFLVGMVGDLFGNLKAGLAQATLGDSEAAQAAFDWYAQ